MIRALIIYLEMPLIKIGNTYKGNSLINLVNKFNDVFKVDLLCGVLEQKNGIDKEENCLNNHVLDLAPSQIIPLPPWNNWTDLYSYRILKVGWNLLRIINKSVYKYDIIWIIDCTPLTQIAFLGTRLKKKKVILYIRGDVSKEYSIKKYRGFKAAATKLYCRYIEASLIKMLSQSIGVFTGKELLSKYQNKNLNSYCFYSSSITGKDLPSQYTPTRAPSEKMLNVITVCNLVPVKGIDNLIKCIEILIRNGSSVRLNIVGKGPEESKLKELVERRGLQDQVHFYGFVPFGAELFNLYKSNHIFALPSLSEGTPKAVVEAMAFGLPIVASRVGGLPDMITDGSEGFLIQPHDVAAIAEAIRRLSDDYELWLKMSQAVYEKARKFTFERQLEELVGFIEKQL